jgi:hypothetical protein
MIRAFFRSRAQDRPRGNLAIMGKHAAGFAIVSHEGLRVKRSSSQQTGPQPIERHSPEFTPHRAIR